MIIQAGAALPSRRATIKDVARELEISVVLCRSWPKGKKRRVCNPVNAKIVPAVMTIPPVLT